MKLTNTNTLPSIQASKKGHLVLRNNMNMFDGADYGLAFCHHRSPGFHFLFWGGIRGSGLRVFAFYALAGRSLALTPPPA